MNKKNAVLKLPWLTSFLVCLVILSLAKWILVDDWYLKSERYSKKFQNLREEFKIKSNQAAKIQLYREQVSELESISMDFFRKNRTSNEVRHEDLLTDIYAYVNINGGTIEKIEFRDIGNKGNFRIISFDIELRLQLESLMMLLAGIHNSPKVATIPSINIIPDINDEVLAKFTLNYYQRQWGNGKK